MAKKKKQSGGGKTVGKGRPGVRISNRRAFRDFHITEKVEAGIVLLGTEVKSLRDGQAKIDEAYARIEGNEVYLVGANIAHYPLAAEGAQHHPRRKRKLLLHRRQIHTLQQHVQQKGRTIVPLNFHFHKGRAKCELGVAEGKQQYDKREALKKRQHTRDVQREVKRRR